MLSNFSVVDFTWNLGFLELMLIRGSSTLRSRPGESVCALLICIRLFYILFGKQEPFERDRSAQ